MQTLTERARYALILMVIFIVFSIRQAESATLSSETLAAWNEYLDQARGDMQRRVKPDNSFLWTFEDAKRAQRVRNGDIVVGRITRKNESAVPGGLIHHWTGAMFMPHVGINDVDDITRDYNRYKDFYRPSVVDSRLIERTPTQDKFSMVLMNRALFLQTALEAEYEVKTVRVSARRLYSISSTTKVQEVKDAGSRDEQRIPEGEGSGYISTLR